MGEKKEFKIAITVGVFDCFHQGHANLLKEMDKVSDRVIVLVHDDITTYENKGRFPVQPLHQRVANIVQTGLAGWVVMLHAADPGERLMKLISQEVQEGEDAIYIRGDDWQDFPGRKAVEVMGVKIRFVKYTEGISTTQIRKDIGV